MPAAPQNGIGPDSLRITYPPGQNNNRLIFHSRKNSKIGGHDLSDEDDRDLVAPTKVREKEIRFREIIREGKREKMREKRKREKESESEKETES